MAVTFKSAGAKAAGTGAVTPGLPGTFGESDLAVLVATTIAGGTVSVTANGDVADWTALTGTPVDVTGGEKLYVWLGTFPAGAVFGPTVTPGSDHCCAAVFAYGGQDGLTVDVSATGSEATSDTSFSFATGISSTLDNERCIVICSSGADSNTGQAGTNTANTSLTDIALRAEYNTTSGGGGGFWLACGLKATAGTLGTWTQTMVSATAKAYVAFAPKISGASPQTVAVSGRTSQSSYGGVTAAAGNVTVSVAGRTSASSYGTVTVQAGNVNVSVAGRTAQSSYGAVTASAGETVAVAGRTSQSSYGTVTPAAGNVTVAVTGRASQGSYGAVTAAAGNVNVSVAGRTSQGSYGTVTIQAGGVSVTVAGRASQSSYGATAASGDTEDGGRLCATRRRRR